MDIATLGGLVIGLFMILFGIIQGGGGVNAIQYFIDVPSLLITFGGSLASTLTTVKFKDFTGGFKSINLAIKEPPKSDPAEVIRNIIDMSNIARKEGLLALEEQANNIDDDFLKKGILLVVDGTEADLVRAIMETDLESMETRHKKNIGFWEKWAEMGPAWGMIGTLIGLIIMLQNMSDASTIGPAMSTALVTTFYGSVIANWLAGPTAAKLKLNHDIEYTTKEITVEGLLSIQAGENPRVIEEKLKTFLPPSERDSIGENQEGGGEG